MFPLNVVAAAAEGGGEAPGGEITAVNVVLTNQPAPGNVNYSDGTYLFNAAGSVSYTHLTLPTTPYV